MTNRRILVIDDESPVRKIICDNLRLSGFDIIAAADGEEGLAVIGQAPRPAIVITDLIMPKKGGLEVIVEVKKTYPSIRLIAMSGGGRIEDVNDLLEKAKELGADIVFSKPLNIDELEAAVERLLV